MNLGIISPSYIKGYERVDFARKSFHSLRSSLGEEYPMIVVDDIPRIKRGIISFTDYRFHGISKKIYGSHRNVTLIRRTGRGSKSATISALQEAMKRGLDLVFLHLDDNMYLPILSGLVKKSIHAFRAQSKFTGDKAH